MLISAFRRFKISCLEKTHRQRRFFNFEEQNVFGRKNSRIICVSTTNHEENNMQYRHRNHEIGTHDTEKNVPHCKYGSNEKDPHKQCDQVPKSFKKLL